MDKLQNISMTAAKGGMGYWNWYLVIDGEEYMSGVGKDWMQSLDRINYAMSDYVEKELGDATAAVG